MGFNSGFKGLIVIIIIIIIIIIITQITMNDIRYFVAKARNS